MSKTKKILSLVLAVVLLMNVFAVSSFATVADGAILAVSASSVDKLVAGGQVTVDFSFELPASVDYSEYKLGQFSATVFYDASILEPVSRAWNASANYDFLDPEAKFTTDSSKVLAKFTNYLTAEEKALYTGACLVPTGNYKGDNTQGVTTASGWSMESQKDVIFSITFDVAENYDGSSDAAVAMLASCHPQGSQMYIKTITEGSKYSQKKIPVEAMDYSEAAIAISAPAAAANKIYAVENGKQVQWADQANDKINLGVKAGFKSADIDLALNGTTSTKIKFVGAMVSKNGGVAARGTTPFVYDVNRDGSVYQYRVVIKDVDRTSKDVYTVTFFAEDFDGNIIPGDTTTITAAEVISKLPA